MDRQINYFNCLKILVVIAAVSAFCRASFSQEEEPRFESVEKTWKLQPFLDFPSYSYYLGAPDVHGHAYVPNFSPRLGLTVGIRQIEVTYASALEMPEEEIQRRGQTEQNSLILQTRWRSMAVDLYVQNYRGLYAGNPLTEVDTQRPKRYTQFPDAAVNNFGINFYYLFSEDKYSFKAAFNQKEIQTQSGGSFFLMPFYNHLDLQTGNRIIVGSDPNSLQVLPKMKSINLKTLGLVYGFGYTWVIPNSSWYWVGQAGVGPAVQYQQEMSRQNSETLATALAGKFNFNSALAKNTQDETFGIKIIWDTMYSRLGSLDMYSTVIVGSFFYGYRF
jgi:hypothetical protein